MKVLAIHIKMFFFALFAFTISTVLACSDLVNYATGVSDCSRRAYLCNQAAYYSLMTTQCPVTCGRCYSNSTSYSTSTSCVDLTNPYTGVSDCPRRAYLCNQANYYSLMTTQCPRTCGRCSSTVTVTYSSSSSCTDRTNPYTGVSDCSSRSYLCNNSLYYSLMTTQCPATCGRCSTASTSSTTTSTSTTCADLTNPSTGISDCPNRVAYCTNAIYLSLMQVQCRKTCGFCT
ncbi:unnamed protein product [Caenorhabditis angaria]|uniref:ShKT domain-containing protein n=1 Tax=Caenorhabditis angaria TaxID=860376 RepID=A0A9P1I8W8_9PELO|nr:unnamed protein product [Caenorhabditis angaria]